jgi:hypothetical protein
MDIPKATAIPLLNTISAESVSNYDYSKIKTPLIYGTFIIVMLILISVVVIKFLSLAYKIYFE